MTVDRLMDADPHAAIIIAGDCNAEDHETPLKILVGAEEDTGNGALSARSLIVLDRSLAADRRFSVLHHGRPQMLDHILVSRALLGSFRSIEAHNETLGDELVGYGKTRHAAGSYHAPLVAEFALD
jgi:predicted extracellular nuclease